GQHPLVVIAVQEVGGDLRIDLAVGQVDAQRALVVLPCGRVGLLGELVHFHARAPESLAHDRVPPANARTRRASSSGCSRWGKWPARSISSNRAPGMAAQ